MKKFLVTAAVFTILSSQVGPMAFAANGQTLKTSIPNEDPFSSNFNLVVCDGPQYPGQPSDYRICDFNAAIVGFSYAGYLYITGVPGNISKAHDIFKKVILGFVIMLAAWFIVYQLITWLVPGSSGVKYLLGNPK
jgi:hypothetical protein